MYAYRRIFQGFLIILLDFRLQQFDLLPDFIGYGMILYGLQQLSEQNDFFKKAMIPAGLLILLSFPDFYDANANNGLELNMSTLGWFYMAIGVVQSILNLVLVYYLAHGILNLAEKRGSERLINSARFRWNWYFGINAVLMGFTPFVMNIEPRQLTVMTIPLLLLSLISFVMVLGLLSLAHKELLRQDA